MRLDSGPPPSAMCPCARGRRRGDARTGTDGTRRRLHLHAAARDDLDRLVRLVPQVLAEHAPLDAFRAWFRTLAEFVQLKRGLGETLQAPVLQEVISSTYAPVVSAVGELIAACAADGSMREGLNPEDVLLMMRVMTRVGPTPAAAAHADRAMELAIYGLHQRRERHTAGEPTGEAYMFALARSRRLIPGTVGLFGILDMARELTGRRATITTAGFSFG
jgi:hypothetical protein